MTHRDEQIDIQAENILERTLITLEQDSSAVIRLSDAQLASIIGGVYLAARKNPAVPFVGGDDNCGPGSCHPACNSWCHNFKV